MDFARGDTTTTLQVLGTVKAKDTGTKVWFKPDHQIFTELVYDYGTLSSRLRELSFLNKGVTITLTDERPGQEKTETFHAKGGLREFVAFMNTKAKALHPEILYLEAERDDVGIELALQYNDGYNDNVFSFVTTSTRTRGARISPASSRPSRA